MISKSVLDQGKAFLCWDTFSDLSIQLIELQEAVAYFFPPSETMKTIMVFYRRGSYDLSKPLFLMFHEAGHYLQFDEWKKKKRESDFWKLINTDKGAIKAKFEEESWNWGRDLLSDFLHKSHLDTHYLEEYNQYARHCIESYR